MTSRDAIPFTPALLGSGASARAGVGDWRQSYARRLLVTDLAILIIVVFGAQSIWLGDAVVAFRAHFVGSLSYTLISVLLVAAWEFGLAARGTRSDRIIGSGSEEYRRVLNVSVMVFGLLAIVSFIGKIDVSRPYVLVSFPVGTLALLGSRWMWRHWLRARRRNGEYGSKVLLVGSTASATEIAKSLRDAAGSGFFVVGAAVSVGFVGATLPGTDVPVLGQMDDAFELLEAAGADTICVTGSSSLPPAKLRQLSWKLEPGKHHLLVVPGLTDVSGPRLHTRPVAGLPLMHIETPRFSGGTYALKRAFDVAAAGLIIFVLSPALAAAALAVRFSDHGPVLFRQRRVGRNGEAFEMLKFRSMVVDAEARLAALQEQQRAEGNAVMFKMKDDPRVTRVGRFLRRYSLDELPQLFNVFAGSMSLVGPRPPLTDEVALYDMDVHRRFLVKPGITGLWQVSGRSNLSWEDTVRMDLYYVENWSFISDIVILLRTLKAVLVKDGAY